MMNIGQMNSFYLMSDLMSVPDSVQAHHTFYWWGKHLAPSPPLHPTHRHNPKVRVPTQSLEEMSDSFCFLSEKEESVRYLVSHETLL